MTEFSRLIRSRFLLNRSFPSRLDWPRQWMEYPFAEVPFACALTWMEMNRSAPRSLAMSARPLRVTNLSSERRQDGLHSGQGLPDFPGQALGDVQGDILFLGFFVRADAPRIVAAVAGVDDDGGKFQAVLSGHLLRHNACCKEGGQNGQDGTYGALHGRVVLN